MLLVRNLRLLPFVAVADAQHSHVVGLLVAASFSQSPLIRYAGYSLLASPLACGAAFMWILAVKTEASVDAVDEERV